MSARSTAASSFRWSLNNTLEKKVLIAFCVTHRIHALRDYIGSEYGRLVVYKLYIIDAGVENGIGVCFSNEAPII